MTQPTAQDEIEAALKRAAENRAALKRLIEEVKADPTGVYNRVYTRHNRS